MLQTKILWESLSSEGALFQGVSFLVKLCIPSTCYSQSTSLLTMKGNVTCHRYFGFFAMWKRLILEYYNVIFKRLTGLRIYICLFFQLLSKVKDIINSTVTLYGRMYTLPPSLVIISKNSSMKISCFLYLNSQRSIELDIFSLYKCFYSWIENNQTKVRKKSCPDN